MAICTEEAFPYIVKMNLQICPKMADYTAELDRIYANLTDQPPHTKEQQASLKVIIELHLVTFKYCEQKVFRACGLEL